MNINNDFKLVGVQQDWFAYTDSFPQAKYSSSLVFSNKGAPPTADNYAFCQVIRPSTNDLPFLTNIHSIYNIFSTTISMNDKVDFTESYNYLRKQLNNITLLLNYGEHSHGMIG